MDEGLKCQVDRSYIIWGRGPAQERGDRLRGTAGTTPSTQALELGLEESGTMTIRGAERRGGLRVQCPGQGAHSLIPEATAVCQVQAMCGSCSGLIWVGRGPQVSQKLPRESSIQVETTGAYQGRQA